MKTRISLYAVGNATSLFLAISFSLCVGFDLLFPEYAMFRVWQDLLPGFEWLSAKGFFFGLVDAWVYGWYFALIWVPVYNITVARSRDQGHMKSAHAGHHQF